MAIEIQRHVNLLIQLLENGLASKSGEDAARFRASNYDDIHTINEWVKERWIREEQGKYFIGLRAIVSLEVPQAFHLRSLANSVLQHLKATYRKEPGSDIPLQELAEAVGAPLHEIIDVIHIMLDAGGWHAGHSINLTTATSYVKPAESILAFENFDAVIASMLSMDEAIKSQRGGYVPDFILRPQQSAAAATSPAWLQELPTKVKQVMEEVHAGVALGQLILPGIGLRTVVDLVAVQELSDVGTFKAKLKGLFEKGYLTVGGLEALESAVEAGNAAAHRGFAPTQSDLRAMLDSVEHLLREVYVLRKHAQTIRAVTPRRNQS